jgi:hypothetical protein
MPATPRLAPAGMQRVLPQFDDAAQRRLASKPLARLFGERFLDPAMGLSKETSRIADYEARPRWFAAADVRLLEDLRDLAVSEIEREAALTRAYAPTSDLSL